MNNSPQFTHTPRLRHAVIVDDDPALIETWKDLLQSHDFLVSAFTNGVDALKLLMEMDVDIILCDLMMPTMAGDMFYIAVERVKPHLCQRFIFITGYEKHPKFQPFLEKVRPVILYKPVTTGRLLGTINTVFARVQKPKNPPPAPRSMSRSGNPSERPIL